MVAAFCEVARIIKKRLSASTALVAVNILLALQKFNQELIMELIDDSNGEYIFTEAYLDDLYKEIKKIKQSGGERKIVDEKLKEFNLHQGDY
ncbi:hypothetical protein CO116_00665 [Candidatus Falkowbacteria bacterium CG_4_9_14_3_um_filter_38_19]|uniref:Uncharacterized protein n=2 Tax=Candidatus Falkowiibacteriota TaxID=1752728 RepID=A0A2M6WRX5_9BACT|nr:MAG: hypothetical protein COT96_00865 [Candidatus Falkowbacteria bacterium CG10_big_fil_rev_8_21_14_0_10_38_22]PJB17635.1 MAG: hypothetical protein CO116_00665 [Candidatus Falkowbacteria bacterium CG_4_9_14_3_um_filter_38_19]